MNKWWKLLVALVASVVISVAVIPTPDTFSLLLATAMIFPIILVIWISTEKAGGAGR